VSEFAKRLAETIKCSGKTQTEIARRMNVAQQSVSYWAGGVYEPSVAQIIELCKLLDITPDFLFGFSDI